MNTSQTIPELSIIIVNWNTRLLLSQCIESVMATLQYLKLEIIVVDNGSNDGSTSMIRQDFPEVILIENKENEGFAKANNQAILQSQGKYVLLLNSDAILLPNAIKRILEVMESDSSIGIAGANLIYPNGNTQISHGALPTFWSEGASLLGLDKLRKVKAKHITYDETGTVSGACMLIRKSIFDQIGLLDEAFFMFNEEVDLCNRCHKAGAKVVYVDSAIIIHAQAGSTGQTPRRIIQLYSAKLHYFYKHFGPRGKQYLKFVMVVSSILKIGVYRLLRIISLGKIRKDEFWIYISKELIAIK